MLDLSNNQLKEIPVNIHELINLSVLNISGNKGNYCCMHEIQNIFHNLIYFFRYN